MEADISDIQKENLVRKPYTSYNPYFFIPFLIWVMVGAGLLFLTDKETFFRWINGSHSSLLDSIMYKGTMLGEGAVITLILIVLLGVRRYRNWWYFVAAIACGILPSLVTQVVKRNVGAPRPIKFFRDADWIHTVADWPRLMENSFPSGHTCGAFSLFTFLSVLLLPRYKHWGVIFFFLALFVAYTRIYLAVHFLEDVYIGSIIGTGVTFAVIAVMNRFSYLFFRKS